MTTAPCPSLEFGSVPYVRDFFQRAKQRRIPIGGALDLTYRCNLRCVHCYVGHLVGQSSSGAAEMGTQQVKDLLSDTAKSGCMFLVLSGGEPLVRRDFLDIYVAARRLGMLVTVFTNATLVLQEHVDVFREYPPRLVEVSLYGATEAVYERVSGVPGSFARAMRGIGLLRENGIGLGLKTMVLQENAGEIRAIRDLASSMGTMFRLDAVVNPRLNGDPAPMAQRVNPLEAVTLELEDPTARTRVAERTELEALALGLLQTPHRRFTCGAGVSNFHLDPQGFLHPCLMSPGISYNSIELGFGQAWDAVVGAVDSATWDDPGRCLTCGDRTFCNYCPGAFDLEEASPSQPPEYWCALAAHRRSMLKAHAEEVADANGEC